MAGHHLVIGGSQGLGRAYAASTLAIGYRVSALSRHSPSPQLSGDFAHYPCDLLQLETACIALDRLVEQRGPLDGVAFFQRFRPAPGALPADVWTTELDTSLTATRVLIERSSELFAPMGQKSIVLVSSVNERFISPHLGPGYHIAKAGLCQLARYYACTLGEKGIRVNAVCPGTFLKPENEARYRNDEELSARVRSASPLGRIGTHTEVNNAVSFLLSDESSFITGQSLTVDGGASLRWHEHLSAS